MVPKEYVDWRSGELKFWEIHCRVLKLGFDRDLYVQNSLFFVYCQCGFVRLARCVFDEMTERSVASWNIMISAYDRINDFETADSLFRLMPEKNVVSWNTLWARTRYGSLIKTSPSLLGKKRFSFQSFSLSRKVSLSALSADYGMVLCFFLS
ncbi:hypothetical protein ACFXTI_042643 [Malus domestica]